MEDPIEIAVLVWACERPGLVLACPAPMDDWGRAACGIFARRCCRNALCACAYGRRGAVRLDRDGVSGWEMGERFLTNGGLSGNIAAGWNKRRISMRLRIGDRIRKGDTMRLFSLVMLFSYFGIAALAAGF
ncbi:hypothetical protein AADZ90_004390 [Aestuariibius sp. 2305UL40-4]|uniref:hypothetical protein n=1 Tax=Aestuariibius violaceus TaxID=3234132 RepID=UPI00345EE0E6